MSTFANHKLYDNKGRRLAIFGRYLLENKEMEIFVLACSKQDSFSKKLATEVYNKWITEKFFTQRKYHPTIYKINIINEAKSKNEFLKHCNEDFCSAYPELGIVKNLYLNRKDADKLLIKYEKEYDNRQN